MKAFRLAAFVIVLLVMHAHGALAACGAYASGITNDTHVLSFVPNGNNTLDSTKSYATGISATGLAGQMTYDSTNNSLVMCNGTSWVTLSTGGSGGNTMVSGWPDAIMCTRTSDSAGVIMYASFSPLGALVRYRALVNTAADYTLDFNSNGTWSTTTLPASNCDNKSIAQLTSANQTFNFVGGGSGGSSQWTTTGSDIYYNTGGVTIGGNTVADNTSVLDLRSTARGFLPPRMTTAQRDAIASPAAGLMIFNSTNSQIEIYTGSAWAGLGGLSTGAIAAFASATCPTGWTEYTPARGRFLRGIDNGAGNDPSGTRAPGNVQADAFQGHRHQYTTASNYDDLVGGAGTSARIQTTNTTGDPVSDGTNGTPRTATETRPKNVAVIFCQYNGVGNVPATATVNGTANYVAKFTGTTNVGNSQIYDNGTNVGIGTAAPSYQADIRSSSNSTQLHLSSNNSDDGAYFWGASTGAVIGGNANFNGTSWIAKATTASILATSTGGFQFYANSGLTAGASYSPAQVMVITPTGNVGIGMATPGARLDVQSGAAGAGQTVIIRSGGNTVSDAPLLDLTRLDGTVDLRMFGNANGSRLKSSGDLYLHAGDTSVSSTNQFVTIKTTGNVGIGTASPGQKLDVAGNLNIQNDAPYFILYENDQGADAKRWDMYSGSGTLYLRAVNDAYNAATTVMQATRSGMTLSSVAFPNGNVGIGTTSPGGSLDIQSGTGNRVVMFDGANGALFENFYYGGSNVGRIFTNGSATTYQTTSDRRLKQDIVDTQTGLDALLRIKVRDFRFIARPQRLVQGFIAQELNDVYPEAVSVGGEDPTVKPWAVDYGRLTPLLVKSVQDLKADNDNLREIVERQGGEIRALKAAIH